MRVLVTGGAGFIGSHLAHALVERGDEVSVLDDLSNGLRRNLPAGAAFVEGDVRDPAAIDRAVTALGPPVDAICHIAGQASTFRAFDSPSWDLDVNGVGTARMLEAARRHDVEVFLFASSMTAYGPPERLPVTEDQRSAPISFYGATKWLAERAVLISSTEHPRPLRSTSFRMFNVYGERQSLTNPYQGVLGIFLGRVLRGEELLIFGDGEQSRDFVYAGDVAEAWLRALDAPPQAEVLNLGTGSQLSMNALWRTIVQTCGHDPDAWPVRHEAVRPGDQRHMRADISRAKRVLGWAPRTTLPEGLARTVAWAREELARG